MESVLKVKASTFANELDVECERKKDVKDDLEVWRLKNFG